MSQIVLIGALAPHLGLVDWELNTALARLGCTAEPEKWSIYRLRRTDKRRTRLWLEHLDKRKGIISFPRLSYSGEILTSNAKRSYRYSPLTKPYRIRLLRLLPHPDKTAAIECQLLDYPLRQLTEDVHLYEALSYVWGGSDKSHPISIDGDDFLVTVNLHKALLHLRNRSLDRILWIDAICINQDNKNERAQQVRYMAEIYCKAKLVIVWLGEGTVSSDKALQAILAAAQDEEFDSETSRNYIPLLLQRPWFKRIWVLQEVAAAQNILIIHEATERSDKVYALLGMSSDGLASHGLQPDYNTSWDDLFGRVIQFILGQQVFVKTWPNNELALVRAKGYVLGAVSLVKPDPHRDDRQTVTLTQERPDIPTDPDIPTYRTVKWLVQVSAKSIRVGDIICRVQGAPNPTLVRPGRDFFHIIVIYFTPLKEIKTTPCENIRPPYRTFPTCDLLLIWDWDKPDPEPDDERLIQDEIPEYGKLGVEILPDKWARLRHAATVLLDARNPTMAEWRLQLAHYDHMERFGRPESRILACLDAVAVEYRNINKVKRAKRLLLQVLNARLDWSEAETDHDALGYMYYFASICRATVPPAVSTSWRREMDGFEILVSNSKLELQDLLFMVRYQDAGMLGVLFRRKGSDIRITNEVLAAAARNRRYRVEVTRFLLENTSGEVEPTEEVIGTEKVL
ncbi:heterokaryon incompatibility protein-domain-containing protein [Hypomontagnella monticulosa]|nr:heterokaryon incompatibility protein-domain-containing protein [Hypomontagnella monticulosa]